MTRVWIIPVVLVLSGSFLAASQGAEGAVGASVALLAVFVLLAGVYSPLPFPPSTDTAEARRRSAADGGPIVFWRPGCTYCLRLRLRLGRSARRVHWVDIWRDPAGAAVVREANGGDETVPTVVVAGRPYVNPDPRWVRGQLPPSS
ncbi:glutaredoxin domain-containing protein [Streptomyces sp. ALB3]|uniref:glutaredoxin domain-containing protein n=1 Tax=Streptomyces sp. ALB3 TaxID=3374278 RepID=UPI0037B63BA9